MLRPSTIVVLSRCRGYLKDSLWQKEDELYQAALASGSASADQVSAYGAGGGNVTESFGNVVSIGR